MEYNHIVDEPTAHLSTVKVLLHHKPRKNGRQQWIPIEEFERVRVSSKSGKLMIAVVQIEGIEPPQGFLLNLHTCRLKLLTQSQGQWVEATGDGVFEVLSCEDSNPTSAAFSVRVALKAPKVCIAAYVTLPESPEPQLSGYSVTFVPHNSGAPKTRQVEDSDTPPEPEYIHSASSPTPNSPDSGSIADVSVIEGDLLVNGVLRAHQFLQFSDIRLKTDIDDIVSSLDIVKRLEGKSYRWKKSRSEAPVTESKADRTLGFIAQEVERIVPELVHRDNDGYLAVSYTEMLPILVEALKEHLRSFEEARADLKRIEEKRAEQLADTLEALKRVYDKVSHSEKARNRASSLSESTDSDSGSTELKVLNKHADGSVHGVLRKRTRKDKEECAGARKNWLFVALAGAALLISLCVAIAVAVVLSSQQTLPPPPPQTLQQFWLTNNTLSSPKFEDPDPADSTRARGWDGDYLRVSYQTLPTTRTQQFDQGNFALQLTAVGPYAGLNYSFATQEVDFSKVLATFVRKQPSDRVYGNATGFVWTFIASNSSLSSSDGNITLLLRFYTTFGDLQPIWVAQTTRSATDAPGQWLALNLTVPLPIEAYGIGAIELATLNNLPLTANALVLVDSASLTFSLTASRTLMPRVTLASDFTVPSPPIQNPNVFPTLIVSALSYASAFTCDSCSLSFNSTSGLDVHNITTLSDQATMKTISALFYGVAAQSISYSFTALAQTNLPNSTISFQLLRIPQFWVDSWNTSQATPLYSSPLFVLSDTSPTPVNWTFVPDSVFFGLALQINVNKPAGTPQAVPLTTTFRMLHLRSLAAPVTPVPPSIPSSERALIPRQATNVNTTRSNCPFLESGLVLWDDPATWAGSSASPFLSNLSIVLPVGKKVLLSGSVTAAQSFGEITIPSSSELIFDDVPITLNVDTIRVFGKLRIGASTCRMTSRIVINFKLPKSSTDSSDTKGIVASPGSTVEIHGKQYAPTWTRLAASAIPATDRIFLQEFVNWEVGQQILIATSFSQDDRMSFSEVRAISAVQGNVVQFAPSLQFYHHANSSTYQTEVGLLSRRIVLSGEPESINNRMGGHVTVQGAQTIGRFSGVQFHRMGQRNSVRYPLRFFQTSSSLPNPTGLVSDCSFWSSWNKCLVLSGSRGVLVTKNVGHQTFGHCFVLGDGYEEQNELSFNLASSTKDLGLFVYSVPTIDTLAPINPGTLPQIDPSDSAPSGFFISNLNNIIVGNAAAGVWSGFMVPNFLNVLRESQNLPGANFAPGTRPTLRFDGNTAHATTSSAYVGAVHIGGIMYQEAGGTVRFSPSVGPVANRANCVLNNTKTWLSGYGVLIWTSGCSILNSESWDNRAAFAVRNGSIVSSVVAQSPASAMLLPNSLVDTSDSTFSGRYGIEILDNSTFTVVSNVIFRNFQQLNPNATSPARGFCLFNPGQPGALQLSVSGLVFENTDASLRFAARDTEKSPLVLDLDSSLSETFRGSPSVVAGQGLWWKNDVSGCARSTEWSAAICPLNSTRQLAVINYANPLPEVLHATMCNNVSDFAQSLNFSGSSVIAGLTGECWYLYFDSGTVPSMLQIQPVLVNPSAPAVLVLSLPPTLVDLNVTSSLVGEVVQVSAISELTNSSLTLPPLRWYRTSSLLYLRVVEATGLSPSAFGSVGTTDSIPMPLVAQDIIVRMQFNGSSVAPIAVPPSIAHLYN